MTSPDFNQFLKEQRQNALDNERLRAAIEVLKHDVESIHRSRHETQENLSQTINEMRLDQAKTSENLATLVASVSELVSALKGNNFGGVGLVAQVAALETKVAKHDALLREVSGMKRIIGWGAAAITLALGISKFKQ